MDLIRELVRYTYVMIMNVTHIQTLFVEQPEFMNVHWNFIETGRF
jgi:hypothetical protein